MKRLIAIAGLAVIALTTARATEITQPALVLYTTISSGDSIFDNPRALYFITRVENNRIGQLARLSPDGLTYISLLFLTSNRLLPDSLERTRTEK